MFYFFSRPPAPGGGGIYTRTYFRKCSVFPTFGFTFVAMGESEEKIIMLYLGKDDDKTFVLRKWETKLPDKKIKEAIMEADKGKLVSHKAAMKKLRRRG